MDKAQVLLTNVQTHSSTTSKSHFLNTHFVTCFQTTVNAVFYLSNNLHLYFSGKTCTANVDRQNMPLSRILQGN